MARTNAIAIHALWLEATTTAPADSCERLAGIDPPHQFCAKLAATPIATDVMAKRKTPERKRRRSSVRTPQALRPPGGTFGALVPTFEVRVDSPYAWLNTAPA